LRISASDVDPRFEMGDKIATVSTADDTSTKVKLNVVMLLIGTRGDLQPALEIAKILKFRHGHRVRIASHPPYRATVEDVGVEFFSIGDKTDVKEMMKRRQLPWDEMKPLVPTILGEWDEMLRLWWRAAIGPCGNGNGRVSEDEKDNNGQAADESDDFVADAVIALMQPIVQTSVAARMCIPLHMFGMNVRAPTKYLPHSQSEKHARETGKAKNKFSFWMMDYL
jgi:hypothetical protein